MPAPSDKPWHEERRLLYAGIPVLLAFCPADEAMAAGLWAWLDEVNWIFNDHRDDSEIGRINAAPPGGFALSPALTEAFSLAERMEELTGGAYRATTGPLRRMWREAARSCSLPDDSALAAALASLDPGAWRREGHTLTVSDGNVRFDFGGLVKGMAVDRVMRDLRQAGASGALVQCGGETACRGLSKRGRLHAVGIPDPSAPDDRLWCVLRDQGAGLSVSTSANYRNDLLVAGRRRHHIFDPRLGAPVDNDVLSVSVAFPRWGCNGLADGLATAGTVMDREEFLPLVQEQGGEALVLAKDGDRTVPSATLGWRFLTERNL